MTMRQIPPVTVKTSYIKLKGGLDLVSPSLQIPPGMCIDASNFVPEISGGYKRIGGYERFDGRSKPSEASYWILGVSTTAGMVVGSTLTGASSGETARVLLVVDATHVVTGRNSGSFTIGETVTGGATVASQGENSASTVQLDRQYLNLAADDLRADIQAVPGSGPVRGVWVYNGALYAFRDNVGATACNMWLATTGGWTAVTTPALLPGGRYEFSNHNFTGAATGLKMYGADGVNQAFQFDGTTFTQITTGASPDTPSHVATHQNRLFLSVLGSLFCSGPGAPVSGWSGVATTPAEIGTGDTITGLLPMPGDANTAALAVYGRNRTSILYGSGTSDWNMKVMSPDTGAWAYTIQYVTMPLTLDDRGVIATPATFQFGNFAASSVSTPVQPFITSRRGMAQASSVLRSQNQYRLYFSDGYGLAFYCQNGKVDCIMPISYPNPVECICSDEDIGGEEVVFFGSDDGFVYQAEVGTSFDGDDIEAWIRLAFNAEGSPTTRKQWRRCVLEMAVPSYAQISMTHEMDYGDFSIPIAVTSLQDFAQSTDAPGSGGFWDQFTWDEFTWDSPYLDPPRFDLKGTSKNISLLFFCKDAYSLPFTLQSVLLHYTPRRLQR